MAKKESKVAKFKIISILKLSQAAGIDYFRLYHCLRGRYRQGLSDREKTEITNALHSDLQPLSEFLGMEITLRRKVR